jgi:catechol 2,3-dioxygenase-like lactoylglutathione lyase family enzyme
VRADGAFCRISTETSAPLLNGPMDREVGYAHASFTDPDGHVLEIAQQLGEAG